MFLFKENGERIFKRNALGLKTLKIAEDVGVASPVSVGFEGDSLLIISSDSDSDENGDFVRCLTKSFGVFKGIENVMEVVECDDVLLINLISGAIFIDKPDSEDDEKMLVYRGINTDKLDNINIEDVVWFDSEKMRGFTQYFGKYAKSHSADYIHKVNVYIKKNDEVCVKHIEDTDISLGAFEILERKEQARQARVAVIRAEKERAELAKKAKVEEYDEYDEEDTEDDEYDDYDDDESLYI